jgi:hypothetical protein
MNNHCLWLAEPWSEGSFQDRRESVPGGCGKNILFFTLLKRPLPIEAPPMRRAIHE